MIKVVFFRLSNKTDSFFPDEKRQAAHDQFILHLVKSVSRSNPGISSALFSGRCATTNAIKESVYASAIREKDYDLVKELLRSGLNPNLPVEVRYAARRVFQCAIISLVWERKLAMSTGLQVAAVTHDVHLAQIVLDAKANINNRDDCLLELAAYASEFASQHDDSIKLVRLLVKNGVTVSAFAYPCHYNCHGRTISLIFALAIAGKNHHLSEFLIKQGAILDLRGCSRPQRSSWVVDVWRDETLSSLRIPHTPIYFAIILGNKEMIERLLQPLLSNAKFNSLQAIKRILLLSCLVGDTDTALKILELEDISLHINDEWEKGITPLTASAWNPDTKIAEALLAMGANIGPTLESKINQTSALCPIQVAAFHGNTSLMRHLIDHGANCNVRFDARGAPYRPDALWSLAPIVSSRPLQFSHESKNADAIRLLLSQLDLLAGDSSDDNLISDLIAKGMSKSPNEDQYDKTAFEAAIRIGSEKLIRHYFSSGDPYTSKALYLATKVSIQSKDLSILKLLVEHRPTAQVDSFEASCLVLAITESQWEIASLFLRDLFLPGPAMSFYTAPNLCYYASMDEKYPDNSGDGITPLSAALCSSEISIVRDMIRRGYTPQASDAIAVLKGGIGKNKMSDTIRTGFLSDFPLHEMDFISRREVVYNAVKSGDLEQIRESIRLIESLDIPVKEYVYNNYTVTYTPLELAVQGDSIEIVSFLIDSGANPNASRPRQSTALELVTYKCNLEIFEYLLNRMKVMNPSFKRLKIPKALKVAAYQGHLKMARLLIETGADVNEVSCNEYLSDNYDTLTALETAADSGTLDMVELLLDNDAKIEKDMRIYYVRSVGFAMARGHFAIADHLKHRGSWTKTDQLIHDCLVALGVFDSISRPLELDIRYEVSTDVWCVKHRSDNREIEIPQPLQSYHNLDDDWHGVRLACDTSENGVEEDVIMCEGAYLETTYMPHIWRSGMFCVFATFEDDDTTSQTAANDGPNPSSTNGGNRVIAEHKGVLRTDTVVERAALLGPLEIDWEVPTVSNAANMSVEDDCSLRKVEIWRQGQAIIAEAPPVSDASTHILDMASFLGEEMTSFNDPVTEIEWPPTGTGELKDASDPFWGFNFPIDEVPEFHTLDMIVEDSQSILRSAEDIEWEGPFTHLGDIDDMNGTTWNIPIEEIPFDLS